MTSEGGASHDICTVCCPLFKVTDSADKPRMQGTRDFMAVEVQNTAYLFLPPKPLTLEDESQCELDFRFKEDELEAGENLRPKVDLTSRPDVDIDIPWLYNPLHDMESLMWLANYFTVGKTIEFQFESKADTETNILLDGVPINPETRDEREKRIIRQDKYASNLFYQTGHREKVLNSLAGWNDLVHPALVKAGIVLTLNTVRARLVTRYMEVEKNISVSRQVLAGQRLYKGMATDFIDACRHVERFSHLVVTGDLAQEANKLRAKTALPVAQLQTMSLQDAAVPQTNTTRDTTPTSLGTPPSTNLASNADPSDPPGGSSEQ